MERRELLKMIAAATGYAFIGSPLLLAGCASSENYVSQEFTEADVALLSEIAETIIPRTDTPGAKDADVAPFMTKIVDECYSENNQMIIHEGLRTFRATCVAQYGQQFETLSSAQKAEFLNQLGQVAAAHQREQAQIADQNAAPLGRRVPSTEDSSGHYFTMMKQLTLFAYFTSELAQTQVLRHVPIPGRYDGCYPYNEGETSWAI